MLQPKAGTARVTASTVTSHHDLLFFHPSARLQLRAAALQTPYLIRCLDMDSPSDSQKKEPVGPDSNDKQRGACSNGAVAGAKGLESERLAEPSLHNAPRPLTVTREALELATRAELSGVLANSMAARNMSRGPSPASFAGTASTVPVPIRKRPRLSDLSIRPVRSNCPSVSYHCAGFAAEEESAVDNNATEEDLTARVTYRDPLNPSFILRRG